MTKKVSYEIFQLPLTNSFWSRSDSSSEDIFELVEGDRARRVAARNIKGKVNARDDLW